MAADTPETPAPAGDPWVPEDNFRNRLGLVRVALGGLNIKQAAELCGLSPENWRRWEDGGSPRDLEAICWQIHEATGLDYRWLIGGGPLRATRTGSFTPDLVALPDPTDLPTLFDENLDPYDFHPTAQLTSV